jgi:DNA repair ATPase RecN
MKTTFLSLLAVPAFLFTTTFAAPAPAAIEESRVAALEPRQLSSAYTIVSDLFTEIQQYTGAINTTAAGIDSSSTAHEKKVAAKSYRTNIKAITAAVKAAKKKTDALDPASLSKRQTDTALANLVAELLEEISGALNNIIATLGLSKLWPIC